MATPQQTIGHYRIVAKLGEGGMGEVWRATDTRLNREVAIKVLPEAFAADPMRMGRFAREAQVLASLNHPGIAAIYGVEERALVMELVEGPTLAERIAQGKIPLDEALPIAIQIAEALEYAHEKGVLHRDLKPANIKITPEGRAKILDFGLAKAMSAESSASASADAATLSSPATMAGTILGTAAYMSPEQARGQNVDRRADIWAFGVVLYEMLTGERPFGGATISDTLAAVLRAEPDLGALPATVRPMIARCLKKDPRQRWGCIADAAAALLDPAPGALLAASPSRRREWLWAAALGLFTVAGFAAAWRLKPAPAQVVTRFEFALPAGQAFTRAGRHVVAISPDGTKIAYVANQQLYLRPIGSLTAEPIPGTNQDPVEPVFSPDGEWIAYFVYGSPTTLRKIAVAGGAPVTLCSLGNANVYGVSWRKGTIAFGVYVGGGIDAIQAVSDAGGTPRTLASVAQPDGIATEPQLLDDGRHVLFSVIPRAVSAAGGDEGQIVVQALDGTPRRVLFGGGANPHLLPGGQLVYIHDATLLGVPFNARRLAVTGGPVPLVENIRETAYTWAGQFAIARSGTLVYVPGSSTAAPASVMVWTDRQGHEQPIASPARRYGWPSISPDGARVAVAVVGQETDVWIWDFAKQTLSRLTFGPAPVQLGSVWSSNGRQIFYDSGVAPNWDIVRKAADGTGEAETLTHGGTPGGVRSVSPDGKWLVYRDLQRHGLSLLPIGGGPPKLLLAKAPFDITNGEISPDGRWLAYQSNESGGYEIYVRPFPAVDSGRWQISSQQATGAQAYWPVWARNGRALYFVSEQGSSQQMMAAPVTAGSTFAFGAPTPLFTISAAYARVGVNANGPNYDVAPDGRFLFLKFAAATATAAQQPSVVVVSHWADEVAARMH